jgi:hypothetical protein
MSDSNTSLAAKDGPKPSSPFQVLPPPAYDQARTAPQPVGRLATGRKPLFRR